MMTSVAQVGRCLKYILEERTNVLAGIVNLAM